MKAVSRQGRMLNSSFYTHTHTHSTHDLATFPCHFPHKYFCERSIPHRNILTVQTCMLSSCVKDNSYPSNVIISGLGTVTLGNGHILSWLKVLRPEGSYLERHCQNIPSTPNHLTPRVAYTMIFIWYIYQVY